MIRTEVERRLRADHGEDGRLYPAYGDYCFANVPATVQSLFDAGGRRPLPDDVFEGVDTDVDRVLVVLVDGYGLDSWKRDHGDVPFLSRMTERGTVTPLTSTYPSETAAAMNTYYTGKLPCEHGVIGWNVYDSAFGASFTALPGTVKHADGEVDLGTETVVDADSMAIPLAESGVDVRFVEPVENDLAGVDHRYYEGLEEAAARTTEALEASAPSFVHTYLPEMDHVSHEYGTESDQFQAEIREVCEYLERALGGLDPETAASTLVVVTADHGHTNTDPERNVDLSTVPGLLDNLERHADGTPVRMAGSPRNVHLHLRDGTVERTRDRLREHLDAAVFARGDVRDRELFGDRPASSLFERRLGDLVLTHRELGTWWGDAEPDELSLVGMHGGLTPAEMLVPFAVARADRVR